MLFLKKLILLIIIQAFFCSLVLPQTATISSIIHVQSISETHKFIDGSVYYDDEYIFTFMGITDGNANTFNITLYNISYKMVKIGYGTCNKIPNGYKLEVFVTTPTKKLKYFNVIYLTK